MEPEELEEVVLETKTYEVKNGRIVNMIDEQEAMRQAVEKILLTTRFCVPWLSPNYGNDLDELIGKPLDYAEMDVERILEEAFSDDDRIEDFEVVTTEQVDKNTLKVVVQVATIFGDVETESEVMMDDTE